MLVIPRVTILNYNKLIDDLIKNDVKFTEMIESIQPYRFVLDIDEKNINFKYASLSALHQLKLVNKTLAASPTDANYLLRRPSFTGLDQLTRYAFCDTFTAIQKSKQAVVFTANRTTISDISTKYLKPIWYFGSYYERRFQIYMVDDISILEHISEQDVLFKSDSLQDPLKIERFLNHKIFVKKDRLRKFMNNPVVINGELKLRSLGSSFIPNRISVLRKYIQ